MDKTKETLPNYLKPKGDKKVTHYKVVRDPNNPWFIVLGIYGFEKYDYDIEACRMTKWGAKFKAWRLARKIPEKSTWVMNADDKYTVAGYDRRTE